MHTFWQDLRYGARALRKTPGFTIIAILTLALGIGANSAIFSVINGVLLKPLPYAEADRLMFLAERVKNVGEVSIVYQNFIDWRAQQTVFENLGVYRRNNYTLTNAGDPERLRAAEASADLLTALKVRPALGRLYASDEDTPRATPVVVLSHELWRRRFGGDVNVINKLVTLNGRQHTIIGVLPNDFSFSISPDIWVPLGLSANEPILKDRSIRLGHFGIARLKPGVTIEQAQVEMRIIADRLAAAYPASNNGTTVVIRSLKAEIVGDIERVLWIILAMAGCVLVIACVNVTNLLLARAATREQEIALRIALGASRGRIARQLLTESLILATLGGLPGLALAQGMVSLLFKISPGVLPRTEEIKTDGVVLFFTCVVTLLTSVFFGLAPVLQARKAEAEGVLKGSGRGAVSGKITFRNGLIVSQVALTCVLLLSAGLLLRSVNQMLRTDLGFNCDRLLTFAITLPEEEYNTLERQTFFFQTLQQNLSALPGVTQAAYSSGLPLGGNFLATPFAIEGRPLSLPNEAPLMDVTVVSPDYFQTMNIPLRAGRWFDNRDNREHLHGRNLSALDPVSLFLAGLNAIVIDEEFAQRYWPGEPLDRVVGKGVQYGVRPTDPMLTVLGVVGRVKMDGLRERSNRVQAYVPYLQGATPDVLVTVRTSVPPESLIPAIRAQIRQLDPQQPIHGIKTMEQKRTDVIAPDRLNFILFGLFATLALTLAVAGLYGVISYIVAKRSKEIGLRMALGAQVTDILHLVLAYGMKLVIFGVCIGLAAAFGSTRLLESLLFGVTPTDPLTFIFIPVLLVGVTLIACWIPARRATKVDPMIALRQE
jgi:putative ABC transport system permease protein